MKQGMRIRTQDSKLRRGINVEVYCEDEHEKQKAGTRLIYVHKTLSCTILESKSPSRIKTTFTYINFAVSTKRMNSTDIRGPVL